MNYGFYLSAAGALSSMHRQSVLANNLANMNTVGFKPDVVTTRERLPERWSPPPSFADPQWMLERLGGGHFVDPTRTELASQGDLVRTGAPLDIAIEGEGLLVVNDGDAPSQRTRRLTRDGRLTVNPRGELVTVVDGHRVLGRDDRPIRIDSSADVTIQADGNVIQNDTVVGRLQLVAPPAGGLTKVGDNLFRYTDDASPAPAPASGKVRQGFTEQSAVNAIVTMNGLIAAAKAAQANMKMMQYHDQLLGQAFNTYGRVA